MLPAEVPVLVVGAGPTGLMLAGELALAGVQPLLIDALDRPTGQSRALGFTVRTLEIFAQRGIVDRFRGMARQPAVHFAGLLIDGRHVSSPLRPANTYPQSRTEAALAGWAGDLGVVAARPWSFRSFHPTGEGYACLVEGPGGAQEVTSRFIVGCDGARSRVRCCAGIGSETTGPSVQMVLADLRDSGLPDRPFGVKHRGGMVMSAPLGDGTDRVIVCDFSRPVVSGDEPVTDLEVRAAYRNVVGEPLGGTCLWASSFTDASALATEYRRGGVLLAGDSAHTHLPAGGQGMNVSIQDVVNLGWKLAAVVQGRAPVELLDTYESERRPVAQRLLRNTAAQGQLFLRGPEVDPLREVIAELISVPGVASVLADSVSGVDVRYSLPGGEAQPLVGTRLPPGVLELEGAPRDGLEELRHGTAILFSLHHNSSLAEEAARWEPHLRQVRARVRAAEHGLAAAEAVLVRPDGHIAWMGSQPHELRQHLATWVGTPAATLGGS